MMKMSIAEPRLRAVSFSATIIYFFYYFRNRLFQELQGKAHNEANIYDIGKVNIKQNFLKGNSDD